MDADKAAVVLRACWTIIETSQRPVADVTDFFAQLSQNGDWSEVEVLELQSQVIQKILEKWRGPDVP